VLSIQTFQNTFINTIECLLEHLFHLRRESVSVNKKIGHAMLCVF